MRISVRKPGPGIALTPERREVEFHVPNVFGDGCRDRLTCDVSRRVRAGAVPGRALDALAAGRALRWRRPSAGRDWMCGMRLGLRHEWIALAAVALTASMAPAAAVSQPHQ